MDNFEQQYPNIKVNKFPTETYQSNIGPIEISADDRPKGNRISEHKRMKHLAKVCINKDIYGLEAIDFIPETFVDIGQGPNGEVSLKAHHLWPDCKIVGVEPNVNINHLLNISRKNNIVLDPHPIVGFYGQVELDQYWPPSCPGTEKRIQNPLNQSVETFCEKHDVRHIDLLKIDCESAEVGILSEMKELGILHSIKVITGEWHWEFSRHQINELLKDTHNIKWRWRDVGCSPEWRSFEQWTRIGRKNPEYNWDEFYAELK
jgi:FkbM family methyltransferase